VFLLALRFERIRAILLVKRPVSTLVKANADHLLAAKYVGRLLGAAPE
jgi:hypothetical protein